MPLGSAHVEADVRAGVDWARLAASPGLIVLHATASHLTEVAPGSPSNGIAAQTPVAVTTNGTLHHAEDGAGHAGARWPPRAPSSTGPLVLTIGDEVGLRAELSWWESRALYGWRVLVPRTKDQAGAMSDRLAVHGATAEEVPTIAVEPPRSPTQMERAVKGLVDGRYQWVVFTSTNAVRAVWEKFAEFGLDARAFSGVKIACVGTATAEKVREFGITPRPRAQRDRARRRPRPRACCRSSRRTTTCSTRSTACCSRAPTSPPRPSPPACATAAGRSTTSPPTAPCAPRRRPPRSARRSRPAGSTRCASPRRPRCATSSGSRASRTPARSSPASARRPPRPPASSACGSTCSPSEARVPALVDALAAHAAPLRAEGALPPPRKAKARRR